MKNVDFKSHLAHQRKSPKSKDLGLFSNFLRKFLERWNGPFASIQQNIQQDRPRPRFAFDLLTSKRNKVQPSGLLSYDRESGRLGFLFWMHLRM